MVVYFGAVGSFSGSCLGHFTGDMITQFTDKAFLKHIQDKNWVTSSLIQSVCNTHTLN